MTHASKVNGFPALLSQLHMAYPEHGFVCTSPAARWEDGTIVGNGSMGALCFARPYVEEMVLSHEALFLPIYPRGRFIHLAPHLDRIRDLILENRGGEAMAFTMDLARAAGYAKRSLTDPFIGACSLKLLMPDRDFGLYARSVDFASGDSVTAWKDVAGLFHRRVFASRADNLIALELESPNGTAFDLSFELARIERDLDRAFYDKAVAETLRTADGSFLSFRVKLHRMSGDQRLLGYCVGMRVVQTGGKAVVAGNVLQATGCRSLLLLVDVRPEFANSPVAPEELRERLGEVEPDYDDLLSKHAGIHSELFGRVSLGLGDRSEEKTETGELQNGSEVGTTSLALIQKAFDAGRYGIICSTGRLPPALQGIWTGTWPVRQPP
jgi:alpha-L-fucosidase 2